jgi:hypothetical protein
MADRKQSRASSARGSRSAQDRSPSSEDQVRALYEQAESSSAQSFEEMVSKPSFGWLMARSAENVAALSRIGSDVFDLVLRNLRIAGRADITRLARQLHRTEDKLERVLQEVEQLRDELGERAPSQRDGRDPQAGERADQADRARAPEPGARSGQSDPGAPAKAEP